MFVAMRPLVLGILTASLLLGQPSYTWDQIRDRFRASNPNLQAGRIGIDEAKTQEITAFLRPNPELTTTLDQFNPFTSGPYRPLSNVFPLVSGSYLHERQHKRELRLASAKGATAIAESQFADQERNLLFSLRDAFNATLQAKAILAVTKESLAYYDKLLALSAERYRAGDIAQVDLDRLQLQRVQFESDALTAEVNLRTAKINLLNLLADRPPVDQFDVAGPFDFTPAVAPLDECRNAALEGRPDLKAALQSVDKARTDNKLAIANGSTDPTFSMDFGRNPPIPAYTGVSMSIPLRIFDRNQGEKLRSELEIRRNLHLKTAAEAQVYRDVDSAWTTLNSALRLLEPYKSSYLATAARVRETVSFAYQRGGASLLDFLGAQNDYRSIQINYLNLVGSWLSAANQLNLAVGREVIR